MTSSKPNKNNLNWVAIRVKPNMQNKARQNLANQAFEYFVPCRFETVKSGNRFRRVERLLFPGYIFARCDIGSHDVSSINTTLGLFGVVEGLDCEPCIISDAFVDALTGASGQSGVFNKRVMKGHNVRIVDGPLVG